MALQTSVGDPAIAVAGMMYDGDIWGGDVISGFASEDLEPGLLVAWVDAKLKTFKKATGVTGEVIAGIVKYDPVAPQGIPGQTVATFPTGATISVVRGGRVWAALDGAAATVTGFALKVVAAGSNKGKLTIGAGAPALCAAYKPSVSGLVCVTINLSTGSAAVIP